jgi:hypothetical protein
MIGSFYLSPLPSIIEFAFVTVFYLFWGNIYTQICDYKSSTFM